MSFHDDYLDVLQNIEFGIIEVYRENPNITDYDAIAALESLVRLYRAEQINQTPRDVPLQENASTIYENVKGICEWRLGRNIANTTDEMDLKSLDEVIECLKTVLKSAKGWNKRGGTRGYLEFVIQFMP